MWAGLNEANVKWPCGVEWSGERKREEWSDTHALGMFPVDDSARKKKKIMQDCLSV